LLSELHIAGVAQAVSDLGETEVGRLELAANQNQLQADFFSPNFRSGEVPRYQYLLQGADRDWSAPTLQRSVNYGNLKPGSYRFMVRAINGDGLTSPTPAIVSFTILPPLWARWWFLTVTFLLVGGAAFMLYRYRVRQLLELERVRIRIATDLHDDIGASLSQIAILSEVVHQQLDSSNARVTEPLAKISSASHELVDSMSDIVWAINPRRDRLRDLLQRMRRFASDILTARNIAFTFRVPAPEHDMKIGTDLRRQVFLIFKESVNNVVRHSACSEAEIEFEIERDRLMLRVSDNGRGFTANGDGDGHGLTSMRARAKEMGGTLSVNSIAGQGTTVLLQVPLGRRSLPFIGKNPPE
jgi:signal transduction histidine kinase